MSAKSDLPFLSQLKAALPTVYHCPWSRAVCSVNRVFHAWKTGARNCQWLAKGHWNFCLQSQRLNRIQFWTPLEHSKHCKLTFSQGAHHTVATFLKLGVELSGWASWSNFMVWIHSVKRRSERRHKTGTNLCLRSLHFCFPFQAAYSNHTLAITCREVEKRKKRGDFSQIHKILKCPMTVKEMIA